MGVQGRHAPAGELEGQPPSTITINLFQGTAMAQPAFDHELLEARLVTGCVLGFAGSAFRVRTGNTACEATLAASCLMQPQPHDLVLLASLENGAEVILAVLFRDEAAPSRVCLPRNSALECPGDLTIRAAATLDLQSAKTMRLGTEDLRVTAQTATATAVHAKTVCDTAELCCRALTTLGHTAISAFRSFTQCLGTSQKLVEGTDTTRCAQSTLIAGETATVMSKNSLHLAEETARTDARLIQLG